jgi:hypothetical protein
VSEWRDEDEVTTTYGSIQLSLGQAHAAGIKTERERIIKLLEDNTMTMTSPLDSTVMRSLRISPSELIALIKGETNE